MFARGLRRTRWLAGLFLLFVALLAGAQAVLPIPPLAARVTDLTATLSADQRSRLEEKIAAFERQKGSQIAVLIVPSVLPETVTEYALRVVESWKLGRKGVDDGALLLVAKDDRKMRIEVGYGLEGALNDATAKRIISDDIVPQFKRGDFAAGVAAGVARITRVIDGEELPPPVTDEPSGSSGLPFNPEWLIAGFVLFTVINRGLRAVAGPLPAAVGLAALSGFVIWLIAGVVVVAVIAGFIAFVFSITGGAWGFSGGHGGSSSSGSWSSGGGGGGFSGGGGSSGGGGASGSW